MPVYYFAATVDLSSTSSPLTLRRENPVFNSNAICSFSSFISFVTCTVTWSVEAFSSARILPVIPARVPEQEVIVRKMSHVPHDTGADTIWTHRRQPARRAALPRQLSCNAETIPSQMRRKARAQPADVHTCTMTRACSNMATAASSLLTRSNESPAPSGGVGSELALLRMSTRGGLDVNENKKFLVTHP